LLVDLSSTSSLATSTGAFALPLYFHDHGSSTPLILGHWRSLLFPIALAWISCLPCSTHAQSISTDTPTPPLQWINLTSLLQGSPIPPLKDASIGYDDTSRSLLIFGGESQGGFPQSQTYL